MIRRPTAILAVLTALNFLNYADRYVLSAVLPKIQEELNIDNGTAGWLATAFLIGYFVTSPFFGSLADRADLRGGRRGLMAAGVAVWSAATFASGLARGAASLLGARAIVGVGEASYATAAPTIIDDMAPPEKKGRWLSIFYVAMPVGSALGFVIGGLLVRFGWRTAFYVVGLPGMIAALSCLLIAEPVRGGAREVLDVKRAFASLVGIPIFRRSVLGYCAQTFAVGGFGFWAPKFLYRVYGLPLAKASSTFGIVLVVAGGVGTWLGGGWADRAIVRAGVVKDDHAAARIAMRVCAWSSSIAAPCAAACFFAPSANAFFALVFLTQVAIFASTSPINAVVFRTVPPELRASAMALSIFAIHMLGDLWSPPLLGYAQDLLPAKVAMMGVPLAIAVSAATWWSAASTRDPARASTSLA